MPIQPTSFVGRSNELHDLQTLLADPGTRCISIVGLGGVGKTRLALVAAEQYRLRTERPTFFLPLLSVMTRQQIILNLAQAIGFNFYENDALELQLSQYLQDKPALLVFDNIEHLLHETEFITMLLNSAPHLKIMVTSRERLNLYVESVFSIAGFSFEDWQSLNEVQSADAARLFQQSARRISPKFTIDETTVAGVKRICCLVDGNPLGLELAAAWVNLMSVDEIADEITRNARFLEVQFQDIPPRHRSLWATFQSSWERLTPKEQDCLIRMIAFGNDLSRRAAQHITDTDAHTLNTLVQKSLITRTATGRFQIHNLLRQYISSHIKPEELEELQHIHSRYYLTRLCELAPAVKGEDQRAALNEIELDFNNIQTSWLRAVRDRDNALIEASFETLFWFCMARSRYIEGETLFEQAEAAFDYKGHVYALVKLSRLWLRRWREGSFDPQRGDHKEIEELLECFQQTRDLSGSAAAKLLLGDAYRTSLQRHQSKQLMEESLHYYQTVQDHFYTAWALHFMAREALMSAGIPDAVKLQQRSLTLRRDINDLNGVIYSLYNLSTDSMQMGKLNESAEAAREMLDLSRQTNEYSGQLMASISLSLNAFLQGMSQQAASMIEEISSLAAKINHALGLRYATLLKGLRALFDHQLASGEEYLESLIQRPTQDAVFYFVHFSLALIKLDRGDTDRARYHLREALRYALAIRAIGTMVWCLAVGALWEFSAGSHKFSVELKHLVEQSKIAAWMAQWHAFELLDQHTDINLASDLPPSDARIGQAARDLLSRLSVNDEASLFAPSVVAANAALVESLSARELEILSFIAKGLSNQDIAHQLTVEVTTVKKHITNIYGKLSVSSRTQAILMAQQRNLI